MTRFLAALAVVCFILVDVYLVQLVLGGSFHGLRRSSTTVHTSIIPEGISVTGHTVQNVHIHVQSDSTTTTSQQGSRPVVHENLITPPQPTPFIGLTGVLPNNTTPWHGPTPQNLPRDFDWRAYIDYNSDVRAYGVKDPRLAAAHYLGWGFREQRVYKRLRLVLRYTACGGLMNQHYSHVAAVTLGAALGAHVILPHALARESFKDYFNEDPKRNRARWTPAAFDTLWDSQSIIRTWRAQSLELQLGPMDRRRQPSYAHPRTAYQVYSIPHFKAEYIVPVDNMYLKAHDLQTLADHIRRLVVTRASEVAHQVDAYRKKYPTLLVDLPCSLFSIAAARLPLAAQVARHFKFSPAMQGLADKVVKGMQDAHNGPFNGLHLRIEDDAADWAQILGGRDMLWRLYLQQCSAAGFRKDAPLYIATGLLTYKHQARMAEVKERLAPFASGLHHKELYLAPQDLAGLHPEQQALIDFLVLVRSQHFVGISVSTFSVFIREYRHLHSIAPRSTSHLVDGRRVGTEPLFARAAVFA